MKVPQQLEKVTNSGGHSQLSDSDFSPTDPAVSPTLNEADASSTATALTHAEPLAGRALLPIVPPGVKRRIAHELTEKYGFHIFPIEAADEKKPPIFGWQTFAATSDRSMIRRHWIKNPDHNIGISTDDLLVIDIDARNGGIENFAKFKEENAIHGALPETFVVETWSGGEHHYYRLPEGIRVKGGTHALGPGVDVQGRGRYVVAPGSIVNGKPYRVKLKAPLAMAPQRLIALCEKPRAKAKNAGERIADETPAAIEAAKNWLTKQPSWNDPSEPDAGDNMAYKIAARLYDFGLEYETVYELLADWNSRLDDPMDVERLERIARSAAVNRQNPIGERSPDRGPEGFEVHEIDESAAPPDVQLKMAEAANDNAAPQKTRRAKVYYLTAAESKGRALNHETKPLVKGVIDMGAMSVVYGESNTGKSFTEMDKDMHIAAGLPWNERAVTQGPVVWVAAEGGSGIHKRVAAFMAEHKLADDVPFFVVPCSVDLLSRDADTEPLIEMIGDIGKKVNAPVVKVTIDTLSRVIAGGDENGPTDMGQLVKHFDAIRARTGAHVAVIHHAGKEAARGARGHSLLRAATDTEIEVKDHCVSVRKQRDMESEGKWRFTLKHQKLGVDDRGDDVTSCTVNWTLFTAPTDERKMLSEERTGQWRKLAEGVSKRADAGLAQREDAFTTKDVQGWLGLNVGQANDLVEALTTAHWITRGAKSGRSVQYFVSDVGSLENVGNSNLVQQGP